MLFRIAAAVSYCFPFCALLAQDPASPIPGIRDSLSFTLGPASRWLSRDILSVAYTVSNHGTEGQYLGQHPGASAWLSCSLKGGGMIGSAGPGAHSEDGSLPRRYFLRLAPGEALLGEVTVRVPVECLQVITLSGAYESSADNAHGTGARKRLLRSGPFLVSRSSPPVQP